MTTERKVMVYPDRDTLVEAVTTRFLTKVAELIADKGRVDVCLTGGTVGTAVLAAIATSPQQGRLDWTRAHFWWGDERWVAADSDDRNDKQAREAMLSRIAVPAENVHPFPATDSGLSLDEAADAYAAELGTAGKDAAYPLFDITFLGVGPDGHIASLFPGREGIRETERTVIAVRESPKPPPERLSLTRPVLNASARVWMVVSGPDKASALSLALAGASYTDVPAAGAKGRRRTVFFVDAYAASELSSRLIAQE